MSPITKYPAKKFILVIDNNIEKARMGTVPNQKARLLAVDDDELTRRMLTVTLSRHFEIETCGNCKEFHDSTSSKDYDLFLMDISLKDEKDGFDLTHELRQSEKFKSKPVIVLTAYHTNKERQRAAEAGIDLFLTKPVMPKDLISALMEYIK